MFIWGSFLFTGHKRYVPKGWVTHDETIHHNNTQYYLQGLENQQNGANIDYIILVLLKYYVDLTGWL